jgi:hypothetical protein
MYEIAPLLCLCPREEEDKEEVGESGHNKEDENNASSMRERDRDRDRDRETEFLPMISLLSQSAFILPAALVHTPITLFASLLSKTDYGLCVSSDLEQHLSLPPADRNYCSKRA